MRNIRNFKQASEFLAYADSLGVSLPFHEVTQTGPDAPLAMPATVDGHAVGNRFAILPMEGWDNTSDGKPTDLTRRRWRRWGESGAKLIFGAEAMAVCPDGRGSPAQLMMIESNLREIADLRETLVGAHEARVLDDRRPARRHPAHPLGPRLAPARHETAPSRAPSTTTRSSTRATTPRATPR